MDFAARLSARREELQYTITEFARKLAIRPLTYDGYEKGRREPKYGTLTWIAYNLQTTVDQLWGADWYTLAKSIQYLRSVGVQVLRDGDRFRMVSKENPDLITKPCHDFTVILTADQIQFKINQHVRIPVVVQDLLDLPWEMDDCPDLVYQYDDDDWIPYVLKWLRGADGKWEILKSQKDMAEAARIPFDRYIKYENGIERPTYDELVRLAEAGGKNIYDLFKSKKKENLGHILKEKRNQIGISEEQVAEHLGIPVSEYASYERGICPPPYILGKLLDALFLDIYSVMIDTPLSENIKTAREQAGLLGKDMAESIGMLYSNYARYEAGQRVPNYETLFKIAKKLCVTVESLLGVNNFIYSEMYKQRYLYYPHRNQDMTWPAFCEQAGFRIDWCSGYPRIFRQRLTYYSEAYERVEPYDNAPIIYEWGNGETAKLTVNEEPLDFFKWNEFCRFLVVLQNRVNDLVQNKERIAYIEMCNAQNLSWGKRF